MSSRLVDGSTKHNQRPDHRVLRVRTLGKIHLTISVISETYTKAGKPVSAELASFTAKHEPTSTLVDQQGEGQIVRGVPYRMMQHKADISFVDAHTER